MASSNPAPTDTITSSTPAGAAEQMMPVTIVHLVLIGVCIALTIVMILWGNKLWQSYKAGRRDLDARGETIEVGEAPIKAPASDDVPAQEAPSEATRHVDTPAPAQEVSRHVETPPPPATVAAPAPPPIVDVVPATPPTASVNELTTLKGLGPKAAAMLAERGVTSIADLAALTPEQAEALDADLGTFRGRMTRDRWHEQARLLAGDDRAAYEATFGKLG